MNYSKRNFDFRKSLALGSVSALPRRPVSFTISHRAVAPLAMLCDALIIFSMGVLTGVGYHLEVLGIVGIPAQFVGFAAVVAALFISWAKGRDLYKMSELLNLKAQIRWTAIMWAGVFIFLTAVAFTTKIGEIFSRGATLAFAVSGFSALIVMRVVWRIFLADGLAVRRFSGRKIVLIAEQASALDSGLLEALTRHGLQLAKHFVLPSNRKDIQLRTDVIAEAISSVRGSDIEEIVVAANLDHWPDLKNLLSELRVLPVPVNLVPVGALSELFKLSFHSIGDTVTIELQRGPRTRLEQFVLRVLDVIYAGTALVLLLPLLLITAVAVRLDSSGPVIFRQRRCGFNGRPFHILKFRTMHVQEDGNIIVQAEPNDKRVTRVGNWLRRTSIDELPQLINVLQGSMSMVGPRPHAMVHDDQFDRSVANYAYRHHVKPGITGWAQVNGFRGRTCTLADIEQRVKLDLWYIDNWNLALDFKIILMTAIEVVRGKNAY
jgi:putative colanic acid biosynthesis UDP-glucose lipid carrier transferase